MNSQTAFSRADLEFAEVTLRGVIDDEFRAEAESDAKSLDRMLVHLVNMNGAISNSPEQLPNVAKRLGDFALTTSRMADRHPDAAPKLIKLSGALRAACERLSDAAGKPAG